MSGTAHLTALIPKGQARDGDAGDAAMMARQAACLKADLPLWARGAPGAPLPSFDPPAAAAALAAARDAVPAAVFESPAALADFLVVRRGGLRVGKWLSSGAPAHMHPPVPPLLQACASCRPRPQAVFFDACVVCCLQEGARLTQPCTPPILYSSPASTLADWDAFVRAALTAADRTRSASLPVHRGSTVAVDPLRRVAAVARGLESAPPAVQAAAKEVLLDGTHGSRALGAARVWWCGAAAEPAPGEAAALAGAGGLSASLAAIALRL